MKNTGGKEKEWTRIHIELCCATTCPVADCERARKELVAALKELGLNLKITLRLFRSEEEMKAEGMARSPALCMDGKEIFEDFSVDEVGVRCRVYADRGEVAPYPTRQMIRKALLRHLILRTFGRRH